MNKKIRVTFCIEVNDTKEVVEYVNNTRKFFGDYKLDMVPSSAEAVIEVLRSDTPLDQVGMKIIKTCVTEANTWL